MAKDRVVSLEGLQRIKKAAAASTHRFDTMEDVADYLGINEAELCQLVLDAFINLVNDTQRVPLPVKLVFAD